MYIKNSDLKILAWPPALPSHKKKISLQVRLLDILRNQPRSLLVIPPTLCFLYKVKESKYLKNWVALVWPSEVFFLYKLVFANQPPRNNSSLSLLHQSKLQTFRLITSLVLSNNHQVTRMGCFGVPLHGDMHPCGIEGGCVQQKTYWIGKYLNCLV